MNAVESIKNVKATDLTSGRIVSSNSHVHLPPNFSAFNSIQETVELAKKENIKILGASNYYYYEVYDEFAQRSLDNGIFPVFGLEIISQDIELAKQNIRINDPGNPGRIYICGKGITKFTRLGRHADMTLQMIRNGDKLRITHMIDKVENEFGRAGLFTGLDYDTIINSVTKRHNCDPRIVVIQERHVAQAFQEEVFKNLSTEKRPDFLGKLFNNSYSGDVNNPVKVQNDIRSFLMKSGKPAFITESAISFEDAIVLILELGGIPCYPVLIDGSPKICEKEATPELLVEELKKKNIHMVEFIPPRNKPEALEKYVNHLNKEGIVAVAGTEHNTLDRIPMTPACINNTPLSDSMKEAFTKGIQIVAKHQLLTANGEPGFVDDRGNLTGKL